MKKVDEIIIHCTATEFDKDFHAKNVDAWHRQRGFNCIGYHFVVDLDGSIEIGRDIRKVGAHCIGHNKHSIGICYVGGLKNGKPCDTRTDAQKESLKLLIDTLREKLGNIPVHGHREFANKACPCFDAFAEYN